MKLRWQLEKDSELLRANLKWNSEVLGTEATLFLSSCSGEAKRLRISFASLQPPEMKYLPLPKRGKSQGVSDPHLAGSELMVVLAVTCVTSAMPYFL